MMINRRLIQTVSESKPYIAANVLLQWCSLAANIVLMASISRLLAGLYLRTADLHTFLFTAIVAVAALAVRYACTATASRMSFLSSCTVKQTLRTHIYQKLLHLGSSYTSQVKTSEVVQVAVEGVDQLETYFGSYLPQFFYSMLAPLTLFALLVFVDPTAAVVLLVCVPLIPVSIAAVQTWAKKLLGRYWGQYTALGDTFLENLQGLTTLKIYQADESKQQQMNEEAENFRRITMKVLTMQLNSITIMDLVAYGGAALGVVLAVRHYAAGQISLAGCLLVILLAADFFLPMRQLGSFFHIAMNGMAASDKIFRLLDLPQAPAAPIHEIPANSVIECKKLRFGYEPEREILHGVNLRLEGNFTALVGESGCGKSTIASLLMGRCPGYTGQITVGEVELSQLDEAALLRHITYVGHNSYLFKGTVRDNLLMACPNVSDEALWAVLRQVKLDGFLHSQQGLDTPLLERAANFSGGQCQRLALARALLHNTPVYIFDEATSNIDVESENDIMEQIHQLAKHKTVLLISHRLANVTDADHICLLENGRIVEEGTHASLTAHPGAYLRLWNAQQELENYRKNGETK